MALTGAATTATTITIMAVIRTKDIPDRSARSRRIDPGRFGGERALRAVSR